MGPPILMVPGIRVEGLGGGPSCPWASRSGGVTATWLWVLELRPAHGLLSEGERGWGEHTRAGRFPVLTTD